ncbi:hypothetical protein ACGFI9_02225 [Micromonospora sp. NPDC048930]|uniref:8-oxoguanine DNA glycosylase OGG fold protein n=1 Tax=Micromonospora sp. NPDC048930 TaxID=3364261 RepID=UPI0037179606
MTRAAGYPPYGETPPPRDTYILGHGFRFNPAAWRRRLPDSIDLPPWLDGLPRAGRWPRITRGDLLRAGADADTGRTAIDILIGAYVWGSGLPSGRGPARLRKVFDLNNGRTEWHLGEALRVLPISTANISPGHRRWRASGRRYGG